MVARGGLDMALCDAVPLPTLALPRVTSTGILGPMWLAKARLALEASGANTMAGVERDEVAGKAQTTEIF